MHLLSEPSPGANARIAYGSDPLQFGELRLPSGPGPHPVVLVIHGGFWRNRYSLDHIGHLCTALALEGIATWSIEYRRIGDIGGGWPGTFQDVAAGAKFIRTLAPEYNLDPDHVAALGHSAGGHLALWLGGCNKIMPGDPLYIAGPLPLRGVVSLAGVCDLRRGYDLQLSDGVVGTFLGGSPAQVAERYASASPIELLPLGLPQVLIHGTEDEIVPYSIGKNYYEAALALGEPVELVTLRGTGHFELIDPASREWPDVLAATKSMLSGGG